MRFRDRRRRRSIFFSRRDTFRRYARAKHRIARRSRTSRPRDAGLRRSGTASPGPPLSKISVAKDVRRGRQLVLSFTLCPRFRLSPSPPGNWGGVLRGKRFRQSSPSIAPRRLSFSRSPLPNDAGGAFRSYLRSRRSYRATAKKPCGISSSCSFLHRRHP